MIGFRIDPQTGVPVYRQLVDQVRQAIQMGILLPGDQLPTVRDVVGQVPINPNTVHRAYRQLEHEGLTVGRTGVGTFVVDQVPSVEPDIRHVMQQRLEAWLVDARASGIEEQGIDALIAAARNSDAQNQKGGH